MDVMHAIETRRSIRKFSQQPIEYEKLQRVAEAFRLAPSAGNGQNWKLYAVRDASIKAKIREASPSKRDMITDCDAILVVTSTSQNVMTNSHRVDTVDLSIGMSFCMLAAHELGLGTCWMANYIEEDVRLAMGLPEGVSIAAIAPMGYPDESPDARPRKPLDEVFEIL